jgi:hypothetical protein
MCARPSPHKPNPSDRPVRVRCEAGPCIAAGVGGDRPHDGHVEIGIPRGRSVTAPHAVPALGARVGRQRRASKLQNGQFAFNGCDGSGK